MHDCVLQATARQNQPVTGFTRFPMDSYGRLAGFYVESVRKLRTPRRPPKQKPDAPENQQRQLREVRDEAAAPRLAVRF